MSFTADKVRIEVGGREFDRWSGYTIESNVFNPPASFELTVGKVDQATIDWLIPGATIKIYMDVDGVEQLRLTGRIEQRRHSASDGSHALTVSGFDRAQDMMMSTAPFDLKTKNEKFSDIVESLASPFGIDVVYSNELARVLASSKPNYKRLIQKHSVSLDGTDTYYNAVKKKQESATTENVFKSEVEALGLPVPPYIRGGIFRKASEAKVDPGESVWDFIRRVSNKAEILPWITHDGLLVIQRPQYDQSPSYILSHRKNRPVETNVKASEVFDSITGIPSSLRVYGKVKTKGKKRQPYEAETLSAFTASLIASQNYHRPMIARDKDARTKDDIDERLTRLLKDAEKNAATYTYTVAGHSQAGVVWTPDTTVKVVDDVLDVNDILYVAGVSMHRSRINGRPGPQETTLAIQRLNVWQPDED